MEGGGVSGGEEAASAKGEEKELRQVSKPARDLWYRRAC